MISPLWLFSDLTSFYGTKSYLATLCKWYNSIKAYTSDHIIRATIHILLITKQHFKSPLKLYIHLILNPSKAHLLEYASQMGFVMLVLRVKFHYPNRCFSKIAIDLNFIFNTWGHWYYFISVDKHVGSYIWFVLYWCCNT